jgi:hypothetical protein
VPAEVWHCHIPAAWNGEVWKAAPVERRAGIDEVSCQVVALGDLGGATVTAQVQVSNVADVADAGWLDLAELSFDAAGVKWAGEDNTLLIGTFALLRLRVTHDDGSPAIGASVTAWLCGDCP